MTEVYAGQRWAERGGCIVFVKRVVGELVTVEPINVSGTSRDKPIKVSLEQFQRDYTCIPDLRRSLWRNLRGAGLVRVMDDLGWSVRLYHVKTKRTTHLTLRTFLRGWVMQEDAKGKTVEPVAWEILMGQD